MYVIIHGLAESERNADAVEKDENELPNIID